MRNSFGEKSLPVFSGERNSKENLAGDLPTEDLSAKTAQPPPEIAAASDSSVVDGESVIDVVDIASDLFDWF